MVGDDRMVHLGLAIERVRNRKGWDKSQLARAAGVTPSYILRLEQGAYKMPSAEKLDGVAKALGLTMGELWESAGESPPTPRAQIQMGVAYVPIVERMIHAGSGSSGESWRDTGETIPIGGDFAKPNHRLLAGRVTGSCMLPHVEPGDIVIWDQSADYWTDRQMVAVTVGTELLVKWAYREPDGSVVLVANDGTEIRPNGVILEGPIVHIQRQPVRGPHRG